VRGRYDIRVLEELVRFGGFPCRVDGCVSLFSVADRTSVTSLLEASAKRSAHEESVHSYRHPPPPVEHRGYAPRISRPKPKTA